MSVAIRIDDELFEKAQRSAKAEHRTVPLQISYWAKLGKAALENPDLPIDLIQNLLVSMEEEVEDFSFRDE